MIPQRIIIDSSVAIKWYLPDEYDDKALKIKSDLKQRVVTIAIPMLFFYEVNNILKTTSNALRIDKESATLSYKDLLELHFSTYASKELFKAALEKALLLNITSYDASYVALAEYLKIPFYTADKKLVQKAGSELVLYLEKYP